MHTLVTEEKNYMEEQARAEHELKNAEFIQMLKDLKAGSITQADMNTFIATMGLTSGVAPISNRDHWNPTQVDIRPKIQRNDLYNSRQNRNRIIKSQNSSVPNYQAPNQSKIEIPVGYDRSTSSNPYINRSKIMNGEQVCLICGNSGHMAIRGGLNCSTGARKLDFIDDQTTSHSPSPGTSKDNCLSNDLERFNFDVFGYELAGSKRIRIDEDDDSEDEFENVKRAIKANDREQFERKSRRQKKEKEREVLVTILDTTQRNLNSKSIPKASILLAEPSKRKSETKLRNIVGREGKGPLDYKKMLENTMITMSMMDFYQASPDFSRTSRKLSTRVNEKRPEEEEELVETSSSLVKVGGHREFEPEQNGDKLKIDCPTVSSPKIPTVDLMTTPIIRTTARKDRAFRIPGELLATRDGKTGKFYLEESMNSLVVINTQAITMGTADGISHRITEWIKIDDKSLGEICTILQGPTFEFANTQRLLLQLTQIPFKNALRSEQFERKEKVLESNAKESMTRASFEKSGRTLGKTLNSKESTNTISDKQFNKKFDDISFSSETEDYITVDGSDYEEDQAINDYKSASTDPDISDDYEYSSDKDPEDITGSHMGKDHVTRMT
ncbi:hypothetical protein GcM1_230044 [Golovinomyces cichoracearum]|uniref:Uncharacterized protein n=1 Tax=Golovinomyces cichoracearum TaxID=62708 RepID=A0A420IND4_9PEZI|nr:hypothetical protein GcM1_230044 [Golovinomyces cichoracearum]